MADSSKKMWTAPGLLRFAEPEDIWDHYKDKASPEALERLRAFLKENNTFDPELRDRRRRRA